MGAVPAAVFAAIFAALLTAACGSGNGGAVSGDAGDAGAASGQASEARAQVVPRPAPGTAWVIFGTDTVVAEVAGIPEQREKGLMDRDAVPDGTGMLFVFPRMEERSFWMRNTYVPLDIAFFDDSNQLAGIKQMAGPRRDPDRLGHRHRACARGAPGVVRRARDRRGCGGAGGVRIRADGALSRAGQARSASVNAATSASTSSFVL